MGDIVGLHRGIQYEATYCEQGDSAIWSATLACGNELMLAEGSVATTAIDCLDVSLLVHLAVQHEIDDLSVSASLSDKQSRYCTGGG